MNSGNGDSMWGTCGSERELSNTDDDPVEGGGEYVPE
jgi:hypothetical protein